MKGLWLTYETTTTRTKTCSSYYITWKHLSYLISANFFVCFVKLHQEEACRQLILKMRSLVEGQTSFLTTTPCTFKISQNTALNRSGNNVCVCKSSGEDKRCCRNISQLVSVNLQYFWHKATPAPKCNSSP